MNQQRKTIHLVMDDKQPIDKYVKKQRLYRIKRQQNLTNFIKMVTNNFPNS